MAFSSRFAFWEQKGSWISKPWFSYVLGMVELVMGWGMCVHLGVPREWPVAGGPFSVVMGFCAESLSSLSPTSSKLSHLPAPAPACSLDSLLGPWASGEGSALMPLELSLGNEVARKRKELRLGLSGQLASGSRE